MQLLVQSCYYLFITYSFYIKCEQQSYTQLLSGIYRIGIKEGNQ